MLNIAIIPARGGSKGIPNKNIAPLCGKPLIEYSIEVALESSSIDYVAVTSDSDEILAVAKKYGKKIIAIRRPPELAMDDSRTEGAVIHALNHLSKKRIDVDCVVLLQPTSPLRRVQFIDDCVALIAPSKESSLISVSDPMQHPSDFLFNDGKGIEYVCRDKGSFRRQDFKPVKFINGSIYVTKSEYILRTGKIYSLDNCLLYEMPVEYSIDIDTPFDLMICEAIMMSKKRKEFL
jgi:CMP-N,N'-diacetyllegionaminic acid synthase